MKIELYLKGDLQLLLLSEEKVCWYNTEIKRDNDEV